MPRRRIELNLSAGLNTDGNPDHIHVADTMNIVGSPDGSGVENREGSAIYSRHAPVTDPVGRMAVGLSSRPPQLPDGDLFLTYCANTGRGNSIASLALYKPRTNIGAGVGSTLEAFIAFSDDEYEVDAGDSVTLTVLRTGALDRRVTVNYATSDGDSSTTALNAVAGTDYTAASGTLTFAAGDASKTITVATLDANQTGDKFFKVTLSGIAGGGASLNDPYVARVNVRSETMVSSFDSTYDSTNRVWKAMLFNATASRVTAHYFASSVTTAATSMGSGYPFMKVSPGVIAAGTYCGTVSANSTLAPADLTGFVVTLWSMDQVFADGAAYSAGATSISTAIKHQPFATVILPGATEADGSHFFLVPYTREELLVVGLDNVWRISLASGGVVGQFGLPSDWGVYRPSGSGSAKPRPKVLPDGSLLITVPLQGAHYFNPLTGERTGTKGKTAKHTDPGPPEVVYDMPVTGLVATEDHVVAHASNLSTTYGSPPLYIHYIGEERLIQWAVTSEEYFFLGAAAGSNRYIVGGSNNMHLVTLTGASPTMTSYSTTSWTDDLNEGWQLGVLSDTLFVLRRQVLGASTVAVRNISNGEIASGYAAVTEEDVHGAHLVTGSGFPSSGGFNYPTTGTRPGDFIDICLYEQRVVTGVMA